MRGQQADLLHESRGIPIIRLTANLSGLQLESRPVARGKLVDHAIGEVRDCGKGAVYLTWARRPLPLGMGRNGASPAGEHWLCYTVSSSFAPCQLHAVSAVPQ